MVKGGLTVYWGAGINYFSYHYNKIQLNDQAAILFYRKTHATLDL